VRRPWEKFTVVEHQVGIEWIDVVRRSHGVLVADICTQQTYPELLCFTGTELLLKASEHTRPDSYDKDAPATSVVFPHGLRGWGVVAELIGRYSLSFALYKPPRRQGGNAMTRRDEAWRTALLTKGN
jgi:hypothetical protein